MNEAWIIGGARTPIAKFLGAFRDVPAVDLGAEAIRAALQRADVDPACVDEVVMGCVIAAGMGQAPARQAALKAAIPSSVAAVTINKMCGSGLKAVMLAAQAIKAGDAAVVVAGGLESMTRAPHVLTGSRDGFKLGDARLRDAMLLDGLWCAFHDCHMGRHAEYTADKFGLSREELDAFAFESQQRAAAASESGAFRDEIVPVTVRGRKGEIVVDRDEGPRPETTAEGLAALKPAFDPAGLVTAGNASMLSDGAAAVVVADSNAAANSASPWKARIVAYQTSGTDPQDLFIAPVAAVRGAVAKAGWSLDDVDLFEINEAFASQMLACLKELDLDRDKVNVHGGAIALGHPIGASGSRVLVTLIAALRQRNLRRGVAALCLGGGNAVAMAVERE